MGNRLAYSFYCFSYIECMNRLVCWYTQNIGFFSRFDKFRRKGFYLI